VGPVNFAANEALDAFSNLDEQRAPIIDAGRHTRLRAKGGLPRHASTVAASRTLAPGVEDSIESTGDQVSVSLGHCCERLGAKASTIDRSSQLGFKTRDGVAEVSRVGNPADVDAVPKHHDFSIV